MKPSSLRFAGCIEDALAYRNGTGADFGGFANAVLEYVFSLPRSIRGTVESVVYSHGVETEQGIIDRLARFTLKIEGKPHFVYIFGEARALALQEWRVIGWSVFMSGKIRMPAQEEMIWL